MPVQLNSRVLFQRKPQGGRGVWEDACTVYAGIEGQKSFSKAVERLEGGSKVSDPPVRIHVRKSPDTSKISSGYRAKEVGGERRVFDLKSVDDVDVQSGFLSFFAVTTSRG